MRAAHGACATGRDANVIVERPDTHELTIAPPGFEGRTSTQFGTETGSSAPSPGTLAAEINRRRLVEAQKLAPRRCGCGRKRGYGMGVNHSHERHPTRQRFAALLRSRYDPALVCAQAAIPSSERQWTARKAWRVTNRATCTRLWYSLPSGISVNGFKRHRCRRSVRRRKPGYWTCATSAQRRTAATVNAAPPVGATGHGRSSSRDHVARVV